MKTHERATHQKSAVNSSNIYKHPNDSMIPAADGEIMNRSLYPCSQRDTNSMNFWQ